MKHLRSDIEEKKDDLMLKINLMIKQANLGDELEVSSITLKKSSECSPPCYHRNVKRLVNGSWVVKTICKCP